MKNFLLLILTLGLASLPGVGQRYQLASSEVSFYSEAPLEDIEAVNTQARSVFDASAGEIAFIIPIREFEFEKSLMQEHFNENYLESDQYPNATFEGTLTGFQKELNSQQSVTAKGQLTIHGVTHSVEIPGTIHQLNDHWMMDAKFPVKLEDYNIKIPKVVFLNIAEEVDVTVHFNYTANEKP